MSRKSNISLTNNTKDIIPFPIQHLKGTRNFPLKKSSETSRSKDKKENNRMKFSYIPKNKFIINNLDSNSISNNILDSKSVIVNSKSKENLNEIKKNKNINNTNNNEKRSDIISIFDAKKLIVKNNERGNLPRNNSNNYVLISNNRKNSKGNILIWGKTKRILPQRYQLNLDNSNNKNNSIFIGNKISPEKWGNIKLMAEKYKKIMNNDKGRVITIDDLSLTKSNKKSLKKSLSKPNYTNDNIYNNNISPSGEFSETFNSEIIQKHKSNKSNYKNGNLNSYEGPKPFINYKSKTNIQSYTINIKNNSNMFEQKNILHNYDKEYQFGMRSNNNISNDFKGKNKSKSKNNRGDLQMKNQVNNNNININNVYINLDNKNKDYFNNENDYSKLIKEEINKTSYSNFWNKSNSNKNLNFSSSQILNNIKQLWKKIGGVNEFYKINFAEKLNYLSNEDKNYFYFKEKEDIENLLNILERLNKNIKLRNNINSQLKNINNNNCPKIEDISKLLISLRKNTIDIINDFINFKKEIAYDLINNKFILHNINNFPYNYLIQIENDTSYLYSHEYLSNLYKFSKYSDPFLLNPSREIKDNSKYNIIPLNDKTLKEIQKANYYLAKEKISREERKRSLVKSPSNYCNNTILIRNNIVNRTKDKKLINKNRYENLSICFQVINLDIKSKIKIKGDEKISSICKNPNIEIINNNIKVFNKNLKICSKSNNFKLINTNFNSFNNLVNICSNVCNYEIIQNGKKNIMNNFSQCSKISYFEIIEKTKNNKYKISISNNINFEIKALQKILSQNTKNNNLIAFTTESFYIQNINKSIKSEFRHFNKNIYPCSKTANFEVKSIINNHKIINSENINSNNIPKNIPQQTNIINRNIQENIPAKIVPQIVKDNLINQVVCPFDEKSYPPLELIYNAYLKTVSNEVKISFKINPDIYYYSTIGVSPKIILFKKNSSILYGMATLSYDPTQLYHRALMITSISCASNYSIISTLLQLVDYCNREIEYDELILYLYFYQSETNKGEYLLNEEYKNLIKTKTKFKWTALENTGNERKIKYHYKKMFASHKIMPMQNNLMSIVKNYTQIRFYRFIKYNTTNCEKGLNTKEYTFLFNVIDLIVKYGNNEEELNDLFSKMSGLKKKRLLKMIAEFNYVIYNKVNGFVEELAKNEDKKFSEILFKKLIPLLRNINKNQFLGLYYTDISANFSSIFKKLINGYEYNIISIAEFNIEVFRLSNEQNNEDYENYLYFFKSENESISFILYELNSLNEKEMENNNNYKNILFNKLLKRILTKDNEDPVKYFKKIGIPSFRYHPKFEFENKKENRLADYDIIDGDDWFDFCIENNNNANLFSFPERNVINEEVKIIENSFVIAILNPDLTVDYHIPALNIYYINKNCWIKR